MQRSFLTPIAAGTVAAIVLAFGVGLAPASADDNDGPSQTTTSSEHEGSTGFSLQIGTMKTDTGTVTDTETVDAVETGTVSASETETVDTVETGTASETQTEIVHPHETTETGTTAVFGLDTTTAVDTTTAGPMVALTDLDPGELEQTSPEQFGSVSAADIRQFTPAQVHVLDTAQFQALGTEARGAITRTQARSLQSSTVVHAGDALLGLAPAALAALPLGALRHLRGSSWLRDLTPSQIAAMSIRQIKALGLRGIELSTAQRAALALAWGRR